MDAAEREVFGIEPADGVLQNLLSDHAQDPIGFLISVRKKIETSLVNWKQLDRLTNLAVARDSEGFEQVATDFYSGAAIAYVVMCEIGGEQQMQGELYAALGVLETYVRRLETAEIDRDQNYEGAARTPMTRLFEVDRHFAVLDGEEELLLADVVRELSDDDDPERLLDMTRGYKMMRMAIPWARTRRKNEVAAAIAKIIQNKPAKQPAKDLIPSGLWTPENGIYESDEEKQNALSDYYDTVGDLEVETRLLDELESCEHDIARMNERFAHFASELPYENPRDPDVIEDAMEGLSVDMAEVFDSLETLRIGDVITVFGIGVVLVYDRDGEFRYTVPVDEHSTVRGVLLDADVVEVPTQQYIDAVAVRDMDLIHKIEEEDDAELGPVLVVDKVIITMKNGRDFMLEDDELLMVPIGQDGTSVYRDPNGHEVDAA